MIAGDLFCGFGVVGMDLAVGVYEMADQSAPDGAL